MSETEQLNAWLGTILPCADSSWILASDTDEPPPISSTMGSSTLWPSNWLWPLRDNLSSPAVTPVVSQSGVWIVHHFDTSPLPAVNGIMLISDSSGIYGSSTNPTIYRGDALNGWESLSVFKDESSTGRLDFVGGKAEESVNEWDEHFITVDYFANKIQLLAIRNNLNMSWNIVDGKTHFAIKPSGLSNLQEFACCYLVQLPTAEEYNTFQITPVALQSKTSSSLSGRTTVTSYNKSINQYNITFTWSDNGDIANRLFKVFQLIAENGTPLIVVGHGTRTTTESSNIITNREVCDLIYLDQIPPINQINRTTWQVTINGRSQP